jgi:MFS family permease
VLKRWGVLAAVSLATLMLVLDFMAVAVALPAVDRSLNASFSELEWVLEAFILALAALLLTAGQITDIVGRRPVFLGGLVVFAAGSLLCGLAQTPYSLIGGRVVQGIGGALLFATGPVLLSETFREVRGRAAVAVWGTVTGVAIASSPLVGSEVTSTLGWHWLFLLEVPVSVLALLIGLVAMKEPVRAQGSGALGQATRLANGGSRAGGRQRRVRIVDRRGLILFTGAIVIVVIGLVRASTAVEGFFQNGVLACFIMTGILLIGFVASETTARAPMLDVSLFRQRTFTGSSIAAFGLSMAVLGPIMCLVIYMSFDLGYSELTIGTHLLLLTVVTLLFLPLAGFLDKHLPVKVLICSGLSLVAVGLWLVSRLSASGSLSDLVPGLIVAGVGLEFVNPRLASAAAATVHPTLAAVASRTISTFRQMGTATGVAVFGAIFVTQLSDHISDHTAGLAQLASQNPTIASLVLDGHTAQALSSSPAGLRSEILQIIQRGFAGAIHDVFFVAAFVALGSAVLALSTRSNDVPRTGPAQLRSQTTGSQSNGATGRTASNGATAGRSAAPASDGARPAPAVTDTPPHATPPHATSAAATLAALGITVPTPSVPDEVTSTDELARPGALARRKDLGAPGAGAPVTNGAASDLGAADLVASDLVVPGTAATNGAAPDPVDRVAELPGPDEAPPQDGRVTEPDVAEASPASAATVPAIQAWTGWSGWHAPHEDPAATEVATSTSDAVAILPVNEAVDSEPADQAVDSEPAEDEDAVEVVAVADFLSYWHLSEADPEPAGVEPEGADVEPEDASGPAPVTIGRRWVRGRVVAVTGEPLAGALVTLVNTDGDEAGHAIAGSDGSFAVADLQEGRYTLIAAAPHFRPAAEMFTVHSEEPNAMVSLVGIGSLAGKVTTAKEGLPVSVDVELISADDGIAAQCRTTKDGSFLFGDLPEGSYRLVAHNAGYRTEEVTVVVERAQTLTIGLAMVGVGHLYGAVTGPGGEWVPGAQMNLTDRTGMIVATTWTDGAGSYRFSDVPEGLYTVSATALGASLSAVEVEAGSTVAADVNLASL